ncbi:MAG TPA: PadR family transcriptional regulator [Methanocella sp.]|uniref:PadR family transcriptional regulator n=1 Tax=Methanocella sp. TaxID=2052833 RepID=UPI002CD69D3C|nr:PadR family transcriptional regulator [Methanocella sp.]HTY91392.1 PadR family transcriptional regulator [Methanocella sp.]
MGLDKKEIDLVILGILMGAPLHGYMIKQAIETSYGDRYFKLSNSALYPTLAKLQKEGYIEGKREMQEAVPDKKVYHITDAGKKRVVELAATPIEPSTSPGLTDFYYKIHAVHFGFLTKEERLRVTKPLYEDARLELKDALAKREKLNADMKGYGQMLESNPQFKEQYGHYIVRMTRFPKFVLDAGIGELENKVKFYEQVMEME